MCPLMFISIHTDHLNADKLEKQLSGLSPNYVQVRTRRCCMSVRLRVNSRLAKKVQTQPKNSTPTLKMTVFTSRTLVHTRETLSAKSYFNIRACSLAQQTEEYQNLF